MRNRFIAVIMLIILVSTSVAALAQSKVAVNSTAVIQGLKDMMSPSGKFATIEMADGTSFSTAPTTGTGDVVGPAASVDSEIAIYNSTTGKLLKRYGGSGMLKAVSGVIGEAVAGTDYVAPNAGITGATNTKITYDAKGLVTSGAAATTADIAASTDKNYVTDAQAVVIGNTSGTNTGDQIVPANEAGVDNNFLSAYNSTTGAWSKAQPTWANIDKTTSSIADITTKSHTSLTDIGTNSHTTIDSHIASTSNPHSVTKTQVGLGSVENTALSTWAGSTNLNTLGVASFNGTTSTDLPTYSAEFLSSSGWTSTGWTGDWATGWTHTTGNTSVLSQSTAAVNATKYQIAYTVTGRTAGSFTIAFGGQSLAGITATGAFGPTTISTANLTIAPTTDFDGTIVISIKSITAISTSLVNLKSSDGIVRIEMRANSSVNNTFIGLGAGIYNTTGTNNTALGMYSLYNNTTGYNNTANGLNALFSNTTGYQNTANGMYSLYNNTTGYQNTANGLNALYSNTTGYQNTANGMYSLRSNTTGYSNTANGMYSLFSNTTGYQNTANGVYSLYSNTTGNYNTANGMYSLFSNTTGYQNTANGVYSLYSNTTGNYNTANGMYSLYNNTTGYQNTANGLNALYSNTTGYQNTANGMYSLRSNTTGYSNTALGFQAGYNSGVALQTNTNSVFIGVNANSSVDGLTNAIAIGSSAQATQSNQVVLGNSSITQTLLRGNVAVGASTPSAQLHTTGTVRFQNFGAGAATFDASGNISSASDERLKNIDGNFNYGLKQILGVQPIKYHWNELSGLDKDNQYTGFSAQNVRKYIPEAVSVDNRGYYNLQDRVIIATLVNAVKEMAAEIDAMRIELNLTKIVRKTIDRTLEKAVVAKSRVACLEKQCEVGEIITEEKTVVELIKEIVDGKEVDKEIATVKTVLKDGISERNGKYYRIETDTEAKTRYDSVTQE